MTRREVLSLLRLQPNDVIVIECDGWISPERAERIKADMEYVLPDHKCIVLDKGIKLKALDASRLATVFAELEEVEA